MSEMIEIYEDKLSIDKAYELVLDETCGGICIFVGTVRNHNKEKDVTHLDFEVYGPMAIMEMDKIANACKEEFGVHRVCIHHRSGYVGIKDIAVIIAVSSVHRAAAFDACQFAIDSLKETVPIWKKEHLTDGNYWIGARP